MVSTSVATSTPAYIGRWRATHLGRSPRGCAHQMRLCRRAEVGKQSHQVSKAAARRNRKRASRVTKQPAGLAVSHGSIRPTCFGGAARVM
eukprot:scaffold79771_cov28-Tisochrysis_lutea.AAC.6